MKRFDKIFVVVACILVIVAVFYLPTSNSPLGSLFYDYFSEMQWDQIPQRYIVENSIPVHMIGKKDGMVNSECIVSAHNFDLIIDHPYFKRGDELAKNLKYDRSKETLILSCNELTGNMSRLNVWYVTEESPKHPTKFQYFVTQQDKK